MQEIKRYRCIKECGFDLCDDDGFIIDGKYSYVEPGSIWQESKNLIAGGPDSIHLDRENGKPNTCEWCEPLKETLAECFEQIESIFVYEGQREKRRDNKGPFRNDREAHKPMQRPTDILGERGYIRLFEQPRHTG